ncbi:hypothetical protein CFRS1_v000623 [Colletotrichum fructicola]|nr:hypothetical protein CFRS1_v000623 [Colletotrichum fructicola]
MISALPSIVIAILRTSGHADMAMFLIHTTQKDTTIAFVIPTPSEFSLVRRSTTPSSLLDRRFRPSRALHLSLPPSCAVYFISAQ